MDVFFIERGKIPRSRRLTNQTIHHLSFSLLLSHHPYMHTHTHPYTPTPPSTSPQAQVPSSDHDR
ncbi:predicted protein [Botrytis cinerea T4]|uniref:Uncharacterized protein n=1 Tax=Botryotinia fuckeliana (strain T4) TaxID=999810 RepID=G2Y0R0_BOTF4|nr:predicted protein [Botrytis cinerea T4]